LPRDCRPVADDNFADYLTPTHADMPEFDVRLPIRIEDIVGG
jgi:CO/xanthine dehydrogenase Mo-binding subunit